MNDTFFYAAAFIYFLIGWGCYAEMRDREEYKKTRFIILTLFWPFELGKLIMRASLYYFTDNMTPINNTSQYHLLNISTILSNIENKIAIMDGK